jgi:phosphopantothenoylcysteine decarboxylase/phosphopantothenate--cysteine ligase
MKCPVIVAPAMNVNMMESAAVTENLETLRRRGVIVVEPAVGRLASGAVGRGKLAECEDILRVALGVLLPQQDLAGKRVLVTAGPTEEPIDPVRHIGNPSTGTMGYALAERAAARGAEVTLVSGPTALPAPHGVRLIRVRTTREMRDAVLAELPETDLVLMAAAPADYRPLAPSDRKIKKSAPRLTLELERTEDILSEVAAKKRPGVGVVGFALETEDLVANAKRKLAEKGLDLIVANDPTVEGAGFGTGTNVVTIVGRSGAVESLPKQPKSSVSDAVLTRAIAELGWGDR